AAGGAVIRDEERRHAKLSHLLARVLWRPIRDAHRVTDAPPAEQVRGGGDAVDRAAEQVGDAARGGRTLLHASYGERRLRDERQPADADERSAVDLDDINRSRNAVDDSLRRRGWLARNSELACQIIGGSERKDAEGRAGAGQSAGDRIDGTVAAGRDHDAVAGSCGITG